MRKEYIIKDARKILTEQEAQKLVDMDQVESIVIEGEKIQL